MTYKLYSLEIFFQDKVKSFIFMGWWRKLWEWKKKKIPYISFRAQQM